MTFRENITMSASLVTVVRNVPLDCKIVLHTKNALNENEGVNPSGIDALHFHFASGSFAPQAGAGSGSFVPQAGAGVGSAAPQVGAGAGSAVPQAVLTTISSSMAFSSFRRFWSNINGWTERKHWSNID